MILALLSRRLRTYVLLSLLAPVAARVLDSVGDRVEPRNPRTASLLHRSGELARTLPPGRRSAARS